MRKLLSILLLYTIAIGQLSYSVETQSIIQNTIDKSTEFVKQSNDGEG